MRVCRRFAEALLENNNNNNNNENYCESNVVEIYVDLHYLHCKYLCYHLSEEWVDGSALITSVFVRLQSFIHSDTCGLRPLVKGFDGATGRVVGGTTAKIGDW